MAPNPNLQRLREAGVAIWLDTLSRELLETGGFAELARDYGVTGATSNPTIFDKAITGSDRYDGQLRELAASGERDTQELFFSIALDDVRAAARLLRPVYEDSGGSDGFISFECTPDLADDTEGTIAQAISLWQRLDQPNVMIKVPGTVAGLLAIEELTRRGVNVNVTLLFSIERYERVIDAYLRGLVARARAGEPVDKVVSVASFFLSRIDTKADAQLDPSSPARGQVGPDVINTMPEHTLRAFADHGVIARTLDADPQAAERKLAAAAGAGLDLAAITSQLEREGVRSFCDSYHQLLACIERKVATMDAASGR